MPRAHFYHVITRRDPVSGELEPLEDILATVFNVNAAGVEGSEATGFAARTGSVVASGLSDANGTISFWLDDGDYNVHFTDTDSPDRITNFQVGASAVSGALGGIDLEQLSTGFQAQVSGFTSSIAALVTKDAQLTAKDVELVAKDTELDTDIQSVFNTLKPIVNTFANRPSFGTAGRRFFATDVVAEYIDTGSAWLRVSLAAGTTVWMLRGSAPAGWREANGTTIANSGITADLYAAIGATMPDLRGRVPVGIGTAAEPGATAKVLAELGGEEKHTLTPAETATKAHAHTGNTNNTGGHDHTVQPWITGGAINGSPGVSSFEGWGIETNIRFVNPAREYHASAGSAKYNGDHTHSLNINPLVDANASTPLPVLQPYQAGMWVVKL
jgi:microcystin-dependent protein